MEELEFYEAINIPVPRQKVYRRLGFSQGKTSISREEQSFCDACMDSAADIIRLQGASLILGISKISESGAIFNGEIEVESKLLAKFLSGDREAFFLGVTAGRDIIKKISSPQKNRDLSESVIFDATASEMVDAALSWIIDRQAQQLRRSGRFITKNRVSAGYGDFSLKYQRVIFDLLELKRLGININKDFILEPEKTVTAVCGINTVESYKKDYVE